MRRRPLHRLATLGVLLAALSAASCVAPRPSPPPPPAPSTNSVDPAEIAESLLRAHNARRARAGLPPFSTDPKLDAAAEGQARDMADRRKMTHRGGDGSNSFDRIKRQGYSYEAAGENVAYGFDDVESVMAAWMKSPGHRRNILGKYAQIGVGRTIAPGGVSYWCVTFGTPSNR